MALQELPTYLEKMYKLVWFMGRWNHRLVLLERRRCPQYYHQWCSLSNNDFELFVDQRNGPGTTCHIASATIYVSNEEWAQWAVNFTFWNCQLSARSCRLMPLDYLIWGNLKSLVDTNKPTLTAALEANIKDVSGDISPQICKTIA